MYIREMHTLWFRRRLVYGCILGIFVWLLFRHKNYTIKFEAVIDKSKPIEVWEYVADFSNMKKLNPTILDFSVEEESGNYKHWKYTVHYTEFLSYMPFIHNFARASFEVRPLTATSYIVESSHQTCFFTLYTCVDSSSKFVFEPETSRNGTKCTESVTYGCPIILYKFCEQEVWYQRKEIITNLQREFYIKNKLA
uniref:Uncharacterized protein n=2 Tax=Clastoptera arizonana TaxID=38151 RepID=A0A1B6CZB6_9HEMI